MADKFKHSQILILPEDMDQHAHHYNQVVITLSGQTQFEIEGAGDIVRAGQGCLVTADSRHAFSGVGKNKILVLNIPAEGMPNDTTTEQASDVVERSQQLFSQSRYFHLDSQAQSLIRVLSHEMSSHPDDQLLSKACSDTLMCVLQRHFRCFANERFRTRLNMDVIDQYIMTHCAGKISVMQLAGLVFLGESQFHLLFKEQTGMTPHQYVLKKRLEMAKKLLIDSPLSLVQVAEISGFSSQSSFTQAFSNLYNISPARYRKNKL